MIEELLIKERGFELAELNKVEMYKLCLDSPFESNVFCSNDQNWAVDQYLEMRMRIILTILLILAVWRNLGLDDNQETSSE